MPSENFRGYLVTKSSDGVVAGSVAQLNIADLPPGDVLIRVAYSSLNYKDALAATGHPGVVKQLPHVPGIDAAGVVVESQSAQFTPDQEVLVTSYELGAGRWGGFAEYVRVPGEWVVPLPAGLSLRESMALGTAGFTAAQCVEALLKHGVAPEQGEIVVTGASGGVGSWAVAILYKLGYTIAAVSGKAAAHEYLNQLGAARVLGRTEVDDHGGQPLLKARWAGAVDVAGGNVLATVLRSSKNGGCVTACGLTAGTDLPLTVYPFILRGVTLAGIDSAWCAMPRRRAIWHKLASDWKSDAFDRIVTKTIGLSDVAASVKEILAGNQLGRVLVEPGRA